MIAWPSNSCLEKPRQTKPVKKSVKMKKRFHIKQFLKLLGELTSVSLFFSSPAFAGLLQWSTQDPANAAFASTPKAQAFLDEIEAKLPAGFINAFTDSNIPAITVKFEELGYNEVRDLNHATQYGYTQNVFSDSIVIHSLFKEVIANEVLGKTAYHIEPAHKDHEGQTQPATTQNSYTPYLTWHDLAMATVIHELAHRYDFMRLKTSAEKVSTELCYNRDEITDPIARLQLRRTCRKTISENQYSLSSHSRFGILAGWSPSGILIRTNDNRNAHPMRSVDAYESTNRQEYFAVNFEHFVLDPNYACHRPRLDEFFRSHFNLPILKSKPCESTKLVAVQNKMGQTVSWREIDLSRIFQIHFLFATPGSALMSRWGHAMFRIVMCRPNQPVDKKCLLNQTEDLVLSYRARVDDTHLDFTKGIFGGYQSRGYIFPLTSIIREYTLEEERDLLSLPLKLSRNEIARFIDQIKTNQWEYRGDYTFLQQNCATESQWFLASVLENPAPLTKLNITTPLGLFESLKSLPFSDSTALENEALAEKSGLLMRSQKNLKLQQFETLKQYFGKIPLKQRKQAPFANLTEQGDYLTNTSPSSRSQVFDEVLTQALTRDEAIQFVATMVSTEELIVHLNWKELSAHIDNWISNHLDRKDVAEFTEANLMPLKTEATDKLLSSYGIPLEGELNPITSDYEQTSLGESRERNEQRDQKDQNNKTELRLNQLVDEWIKESNDIEWLGARENQLQSTANLKYFRNRYLKILRSPATK